MQYLNIIYVALTIMNWISIILAANERSEANLLLFHQTMAANIFSWLDQHTEILLTLDYIQLKHDYSCY